MKTSQRQRLLNVIAKTHHAMLMGKEYDSMREFRAGRTSIKPGSVKEKMVADLRERGLSDTETTIKRMNGALKHG